MESAEPEHEATQHGSQSKGRGLFFYHAATAVLILLFAVILRSQKQGCADELNNGEWLEEGVWQPRHCTLHHFQSSELKMCASEFRHVVVVGVEKWAVAANLLCPTETETMDKVIVDSSQATSSQSCTVLYVSQSNSCAEDGQVAKEYLNLAESSREPVLVIHQPLIHVSLPQREGQLDSEQLASCRGVLQAQLNAQLKLLKARPGSLVVQLDSNPIWRSREAGGVEATELYRDIYSSAGRNSSRLQYLTSPFASGFPQRMFIQSADLESNLPPELSLVLNTFCASSSSYSCCADSSHSHYFTTTILIFIIAMYIGVELILLSGATFAIIPHLEAINFDLDGLISVLHSIGGGAFIMLYLLMADGMGFFSSAENTYSPWMFMLCVLAVAAVATLSCKKIEAPEFLSADKCNAWRGGMILLYIALQYCSMDQMVAGKLFSELMVGGLVFVSGYTHFTHYWRHPDFTWRRLATVLLRLNLLPVLVAVTLGTSYYSTYSLPVLLSLGFLFTTAIMASWPQMTLTSMQGMSVQGPQHVVVVVKFGLAFLLVSLLPWLKGVVEGVVSLPLLRSVLQSDTVTADTLYHWMYTHRYMTLGGMAFAYVMCNVQSNVAGSAGAGVAASDGFRKLKVVTTCFSMAIILGYGIFLIFAEDFSSSSESQSLIAQPVILSYCLLRYFSEPLHRYESGLLTALGSSSVWLFVSHQHILLSQSGSAHLVLFPRTPPPLVNSLLVLCVFLFCQRLMNLAQTTLTHYTTHSFTTTVTTQPRTPPLTVM